MRRKRLYVWLGTLGLAIGIVGGCYTAAFMQRAELRRELSLARSEGLPTEPADLRRMSVPDQDNALPDLLQAWALLHSRFLEEDKRLTDAVKNVPRGQQETLDRQTMVDLATIQPVIACLRDAAHKPAVDFHRDWEAGPNGNFDFADVRNCVRLLAADGMRLDKLGRQDAGTADFMDAGRLAALIATERDVNAAYVSLNCEASAEQEVERRIWDEKIRPGIGTSVRRIIAAMGPLPDVRHILGGQLVLEREGIRDLQKASLRSIIYQFGHLRSLRFSHLAQVRIAYDIRVVQAWRALFRMLPPDDSDPMAADRALYRWATWLDSQTDWTYDYLHMKGFGLANLTSELEAQLARRRVLVTLGDLLEMKAEGKRFDGKLSRTPDHIDPCTGNLLKVIPKPGGWIVYSLGPDQVDFHGSRSQGEFANVRQNIVAEYPRPSAKPLTLPRLFRSHPTDLHAQAYSMAG